MKIVCSNCRTMNLLPETITDSSISRMTCARCGAMMDLPAETLQPPAPPPALVPPVYSAADAPPEAATDHPNYYAPQGSTPMPETESAVNGPMLFAPTEEYHAPSAEAAHPAEYSESHDGFDEDGYYEPAYVPPPPPDRTGRFFKIAARVLLAAAIVAAIFFFLVPYVRQYLASSNGKNTAGGNAPRANLPPPLFTPTPGTSSSPAANVNGATNANASPQPSGSANTNSATPTPSPTPASTPTPKSTPPPAPTDSGSGSFAIQVGSHPDANSANQQVAQLQAKGLSARTVQAAIPGRGTWYRVRIGHFASRDEATRYGASLRSKGVADFYVTDDGK